MDNSLENLDDQEELWKSLSMKKHTLKDRHAKLREKLQKLEMKVTNPESGKERQFKDSRVYHLWALAQKTNMTEEELESLKVRSKVTQVCFLYQRCCCMLKNTVSFTKLFSVGGINVLKAPYPSKIGIFYPKKIS